MACAAHPIHLRPRIAACPVVRNGLGRWLVAALLALAALSLGGCAGLVGRGGPSGGSAAAGQPAAAAHPADPFERYNRRMFAFNDRVDQMLLRPVAEAYRDLVPALVRAGIGNALGNVRDLWSAANHLLQGKLGTGSEMGMRFITNTVFGLGGLLDPATELGLRRQSEDFGQTLGAWGLGSGPYLVLPLLGPSSLRDAAALPLDMAVSLSSVPPHRDGQLAVSLLNVVDVRAGLLSTTRMLNDVALDRYSFVREAFLARRLDLVYDGNPPLESFDDGDDDPPKDGEAGATKASKPVAPQK